MDSTATGIYQHTQTPASGLYPIGFPSGNRGAISSSTSNGNKGSSATSFSASPGNIGGCDNNGSIGLDHMSIGGGSLSANPTTSNNAGHTASSSECNINMRNNAIPLSLGNSATANTGESSSSNSSTAAAAAAAVAAALNPCYAPGSIELAQCHTVPSQSVPVGSHFGAGVALETVALDQNGCPLYTSMPQTHQHNGASHQHGVTGDQQHCLTPMSGIPPPHTNYSPFSAPATAGSNSGSYVPSNARISVIGDPLSSAATSAPATAHAYPANSSTFVKHGLD
ncbi:hypothetical protein IW138_004464 [Coemansia sp. RSA 986]|nr:hypothetical protein LPJ74_004175 [Coemansia sp. RSA 1843]KAJ2088125.1 hypothetical protein IW138_004464 [Coemansia sp. RSA 986]